MQLPKLNKKGMSISQLPMIAIVFSVAFIILGLGAVILNEFKDTVTTDYTETMPAITAADPGLSSAAENITVFTHDNLNSISISEVYNATPYYAFNTGNYSTRIEGTGVTFDWHTAEGDFGGVRVNYTLTVYSGPYNATRNGLSGMSSISSWGAILGICIGASLVLAVLIAALMPGRKEGGL